MNLLVVLLLIATVQSSRTKLPEPSAPKPFTETTPSPYTTTAPPSSFQVPTQRPDEPWRNPNLFLAMKPLRYDLLIKLYAREGKFEGEVSIDIDIRSPTNVIYVHAEKLVVFSSEVFFKKKSLKVTGTFEYTNNSFWVVTTKEQMQMNDIVKLTLKFKGGMGQTTGIVDKSFWDEERKRRSSLLISVFKPYCARLGFPNFDEPFYKARFTITLRHWANLTAASNMPIDTLKNIDSVWQETKFIKTPPLSSSDVGFVISELGFNNYTLRDGKQYRLWARPGKMHLLGDAWTVTSRIRHSFNSELGNITSQPKIDQFAIPNSGFGRESSAHWGLIIYDEEVFAFNPLLEEKEKVANMVNIATELATMYFGNLVKCEYWTHVWKDLGLAHFYGLKAAGSVTQAWYEGQRLKELTLYADAFPDSRPLALNRMQSWRKHDTRTSLVLSKGAAVIKMLEAYIGEVAFRQGIKKYIKEYSFDTATTKNFFASIQSVVPRTTNISDFMKTWVNSMGYPVITIQRLRDNRVRATQKRFLIDPYDNPKEPPAVLGYQWNVVLNYKTQKGRNHHVFLNKKFLVFHANLSAQDKWILFNHDQSGYYRVNYERPLLDNITTQLKVDYKVFNGRERAQLLSDVLNLARAEQLEYDVALNMTMYAWQEQDIRTWNSLYNDFDYIHLMLVNTSHFKNYQRYILNLTTNLMNRLEVADSRLTTHRLLGPMIASLSCSAGHRGCIENTTRLFKTWIQNDQPRALTVNFRRLVCCYGIANSTNESEWSTTFKRFFELERDRLVREAMLSGMACTKNLTLLRRLLDTYFHSPSNKRLSTSDLLMLMKESSSNPTASSYIWKWLSINGARISRDVNAELAYEISRGFNTEAQLQEVRDFFEHYVDARDRSESVATLMTQTDMRIKANARWMYKQYAVVASWLQRNFPV